MALKKIDTIDFINVKSGTDLVFLNLIDEADWQDEKRHVYLLQEKINNYLSFIENGELNKAYPKAVDSKLVIRVIARYPATELGLRFFEKAKEAIVGAGFDFCYEHRPSKDD